MSSDEGTDREGNAKKRKIQRACDVCRRKKIRCDGPQMTDSKCSNCVAYNFNCTYNETARKRGPPKGYVESLENRLEKMEALLTKLCPDGDFSQELGGRFDKETWMRTKGALASARATTSKETPSPVQLPTPLSHASRTPSEDDDLPPSDDDVPPGITLSKWLQELHLNPATPRFFGKSSGARLVKNALALKSDLTGVEPRSTSLFMQDLRSRRPEYWHIHPWERKDLGIADGDRPHGSYVFPEPDLLPILVAKFFTEVNILFPVLHRPTFERSVAEGLYLHDDGFASVLLVVAAVGSRFVEDPRVLLDTASEHSAGWKYFNQVQMVRKSLLAPPRLYDVQLYCLATIFLQGSSAPQACWSIVGIGIRLAQDIGAHRRKLYDATPSVHDELWKRAFWVLVAFDRGISSGLGRPCAIQDEDFDVDMPIECDDEYWENPEPEKAFQQPAGKPAKVSFFISLIKLNQILAFALRTIYSINKSKVLLGFVGPEWEQNIVSELDSALNKWVDSIPDHLRWDPKREDDTFFHQSAVLYSAYYQLQIAIHRPFIPNRGRQPSMALPALAICTNAARSCSHVIDIQQARRNTPLPMQTAAAFTSGVVLLLSIWGGKRGGVVLDPAKEMADVYRCMNVLKQSEKKWHIAGRFWDILWELASVSDLPLPTFTPPALKRDREDEDNTSPQQSTGASTSPADAQPRHFAGSRRVHASQADNPISTGGANVVYPAAGPSTMPQGQHNYGYQQTPVPHQQPQQQQWAQPGYTDPLQQQYSPSVLGTAAATFDAFAPPLTQGGYTANAATWWPPTDATHAFDQMVGGIYGAPPTIDTAPAGAQDPFGALDALIRQPGIGLNQQTGQGFMNDDVMSVWTNAPASFESEDWSSYITGMTGAQPGRGARSTRQ